MNPLSVFALLAMSSVALANMPYGPGYGEIDPGYGGYGGPGYGGYGGPGYGGYGVEYSRYGNDDNINRSFFYKKILIGYFIKFLIIFFSI